MRAQPKFFKRAPDPEVLRAKKLLQHAMEQKGQVVYDPDTDQLYIYRGENYNGVREFRTDMWTPWMLALGEPEVKRLEWLGDL